MMKGWEEKTLADLGYVSRGKSRHRPRNAPELYGGKYPLIQTGDIEAAGFYLTEYNQTYSELGLAQSKLWPKDTLCISIVGANTGASAILKFDACFPDSVIGFIPFEGVSDVRFVKYSLELLRVKLKHISEGAARENLSMEKLLTVKINTPSIETQRRIASILSAYDDLIENNLRRIKLLEELAQRTYEEWFVRFRFPGHETAVFNAETGLPEGWERRNLLEIADINFGYPFKANQFNNSGLGTPIIRIRNIPSSTTSDFTTEIVDKKYLVKTGDLLVGMDGEFYINNWSGPKAYLVQRSCNIQPKKEILRGYLSQAIVHPIKYFEATISGATVAHLGKRHLETIEIIIPDNEKLIQVFNDWLSLKLNLSIENSLLKQSRDILLPHLMSGEIEIEN